MSDLLTKKRAFNRRLNIFILGLCAGLPTVAFGVMFFEKYERIGDGRNDPVEMTAAELLEKGPDGAKRLRITGLQVGPEYYQEGGEPHKINYWLPAAPAADPSLAEFHPGPAVRVFYFKIPGVARDDVVKRIEDEGTFTGIVEDGPDRWHQGAKLFFRRSYPGSDLDRAVILRRYNPDREDDFWSFLVLFLAGLMFTAVCFWLVLWLYRRERPKPPPLPWD